MSADRRDFLKTLGGVLAAGACAGPLTETVSINAQTPAARPKVVVLWEEGLPTVDGLNLARGLLETALSDFATEFWDVAQFIARIEQAPPDLFINPYGAAFPVRAWYPLHQYLWPGRHWLNLGGVPLAVPCARTGGAWRAEVRQVQYHKRFGIYQTFSVKGAVAREWRDTGILEGLSDFAAQNTVAEAFEMYVRFTSTNDYPNEVGTVGQRDAKLTPLVIGYDAEGRRVAAPIVQIDRLLGDYSGGRWIWANYSGSISATTVKLLATQALRGASELVARPSYACYRQGERPTINVQMRRPAGDLKPLENAACTLTIDKVWPVDVSSGPLRDNPTPASNVVPITTVALIGQGAIANGTTTYAVNRELTPGLYSIETRLKMPATNKSAGYELKHRNAFWVYDEQLMASGAPLTTDKHFFYRDGEPFPITGTTYMASDVSRKYLLEPNPLVWDADFKDMKAAGVNMIRTGLWTAWKNYMLDVGTVNETALRSLDAFMLTARRYDIPVTFTFFAFLPELWGGQNAYLDPRAVRAQQQFLAIIAQRYASMKDTIWDLINEPSFCNPNRLWSCRPNYDAFEQEAWHHWLRERHPAASDEERETTILERWRATPWEGLGLPRLEDFDGANLAETRRPLKVIDYKLFAQEMFTRWVGLMTTALRSNGNAQQLITVGQDEAGLNDSPSPQFHAGAMAFTCLHNWWANDDLLWDNVLAKAPSVPNLVQETGLMSYEKLDGTPWRTPETSANLLERKMALAIGANGAGFIEWVWNINPYMMLDNEAAIGFHYVSGAAKPELQPFLRIARFAAANRKWFKDKQDEEVMFVIPHTHLFAPRSNAVEATRRSIRAWHYHCLTPVRAVSEYKLGELTEPLKVICVPAPYALTQTCWDALLSHAARGALVVITGPLDYDEHWLPVARTKALNLNAIAAPVVQSETLLLESRELPLRFGGDKIQRLEKAVVNDEKTARVYVVPHGTGKIIWCPVPLEAGDTTEPVAEFYRYALAQTTLTPSFSVTPPTPAILVRPTVFAQAVLYTLVSETDRDTALQITHAATKTRFSVNLPAQRTGFVLLSRTDGKVLATTLEYNLTRSVPGAVATGYVR